jgi:hypothetical protein
MAFPLPEEVLRTLQDLLSLHQTLCAEHATDITHSRLSTTYDTIHHSQCPELGTRYSRYQRLDLLAAFRNESGLVISFLGER